MQFAESPATLLRRRLMNFFRVAFDFRVGRMGPVLFTLPRLAFHRDSLLRSGYPLAAFAASLVPASSVSPSGLRHVSRWIPRIFTRSCGPALFCGDESSGLRPSHSASSILTLRHSVEPHTTYVARFKRRRVAVGDVPVEAIEVSRGLELLLAVAYGCPREQPSNLLPASLSSVTSPA